MSTSINSDVVQSHEEHTTIERKRWYRSSMFNACVIGMVGFMSPGLWNAMNSLGAGGAQKPFLVNAANALVFGLMGFFCLFGGPIANRIGLKWTLVLGAVGYPVYSAGLYTNNRYGNVWFVLVGAVACGISAGLFWASEGAVALGYPPPAKRGQYMNIWLVFRTGGPILGGAILLGLNHSANQKTKGKVGYRLTLGQVQRSDGSKVKIVQEKSFAAELRALVAASKRRDILLLLPVFWAAYFNQYSGNFQTYYFGLRARCLIGFLTNFSGILSSFLVSTLLDYKPWPVKKRLNICFFYVLFWHLLAWSYGWAIQEKYTRTNPAVSFGINTRDWKGGRVPLAVNTVLLGLAVVPTWIALQEHVPVEGPKKFEDVGELAEQVTSQEDKAKYAVRQTATEV
ncbi:MFS general substrate transporter, partial [Aureobasidium melanogenum]